MKVKFVNIISWERGKRKFAELKPLAVYFAKGIEISIYWVIIIVHSFSSKVKFLSAILIGKFLAGPANKFTKKY